MAGILNITQASIIAMHAALLLAEGPGKPVTNEAAAKALRVSGCHLAKLLQRLAKAGIVRSLCGPKGGYILNRPLAEIRLRDILEAVEGPLKLQRRMPSKPRVNDGQVLEDFLDSVHNQVIEHLERNLSEICAQ